MRGSGAVARAVLKKKDRRCRVPQATKVHSGKFEE